MLDKKLCKIFGIPDEERELIDRVDILDGEMEKIKHNNPKYKNNPELILEVIQQLKLAHKELEEYRSSRRLKYEREEN